MSALHTTGSEYATREKQVPKGSQATARLHRGWLKNVLAETRLPPTRLAQEIKIAPSTLTRPLKEGDDGTSTLNARTIEKIVLHTGFPPPGMTGLPSGRRPMLGLGDDAAPYQIDAGNPIEAVIAAIRGERNSLVPWLLQSRAVELAGFLPGDLLLLDMGAAPHSGDVVCAQVKDYARNRTTNVVRVYERASPVELLVARSLDPVAAPIVVDGERVVIRGVFLPHRLRSTPAAESDG